MCKCKISKTSRIAILVGIGVLALWAGSWWWISQHFQNPDERGTFGDMFGAINALFSGLAFAGLIITLLYQKEELTLQREELKATRAEMKSQRMEFEEQNKTLKRQRFENTFFNMLSLQNEIVAGLSYEETHILPPYRMVQHKNREVFMVLYLQANFLTTPLSQLKIPALFNHYFRHLYRIYKYIDNTDLIANGERYDYACIVRSQLSDYELAMLFYNCLTENGCEKFKPLIEKYAIFNNLRPELLANPNDKSLYAASAYSRDAE